MGVPEPAPEAQKGAISRGRGPRQIEATLLTDEQTEAGFCAPTPSRAASVRRRVAVRSAASPLAVSSATTQAARGSAAPPPSPTASTGPRGTERTGARRGQPEQVDAGAVRTAALAHGVISGDQKHLSVRFRWRAPQRQAKATCRREMQRRRRQARTARRRRANPPPSTASTGNKPDQPLLAGEAWGRYTVDPGQRLAEMAQRGLGRGLAPSRLGSWESLGRS